MIRVVIDTNVLVSGFRSPSGNPALVIKAVREGLICPCVSDGIFSEYPDVLRRSKFGFAEDEVTALLSTIQEGGALFHPAAVPVTGPDPNDFMFMPCAMEAQAEYLVTGNRRHFPERFHGAARVVNARELIDRIVLGP